MAGIPQVITEDRASGALVIDGSLNFFQESNPYLKFTPGSDGNRSTWTISFWALVDPTSTSTGTNPFIVATTDGMQWEYEMLQLLTNDLYYIDYIGQSGGANILLRTNAKFRDIGWYHFMAVKVNNSTFKLYVNGEELTSFSSNTNNGNQSTHWNKSGVQMNIGGAFENSNAYSCHSKLSQFYFIDGQALGPEYFGFTDPLTNTWRPKKYDQLSPNNGSTWSSYLTSSTSNFYTGAQGVEKAFDGDTSTYVQQVGGVNPNYITFTPPSGIAHTSKVEIFINNAQNEVSYNGGSLQSISSGWNTIATGSGTLTSIRVERPSTNGAAFGAISIDGVILIDGDTSNMGTNGFYLPMDGKTPIGKDQSGRGNDWTPVNFGGSVTLDNPTVSGAIPILNTNEAGTVAKRGVRTDKKTYTVTAAGGKYYLDGVLTPTLNFLRGGTYIFDYTAASGHPFKFSTTSDGTHNSGSEYTDGTNTSTTNVMKITVPHNAPDTLYYYCNIHSGMGSSINVTTDIRKADPYAWKNVLALPLVGGSADVSDQINVGSTAKAANNNNGSATASSVASNFYNGSFYFDGNDTLRYDSLSHIGTGDFTVECWYYKTSHNSYERVVSTSTGTQTDMNLGFVLGRDVSGETSFSCGGNSVSGPTISLNTWHHLAGVRDNGVLEFFVDGVSQGTVANTTNLTNTDQIYVSGNYNGGSEFLNGYIQDARIYIGVAKYTSNFVVPSTSPDILPDTPSGVSGSSKLAKITEGAVNFGDASSYLSLSNTTDVNFGDGAFTWECFAYFTSVSGSVTVMGQWENSPNRRSWLIQVNDGKLQSYVSNSGNSGGDSRNADSPANYMAANRWYHIAVTRSGNDMRLFIDGKLITTTDLGTFTVYANTNDGWQIGAQNTSGSHKMKGLLSDVRIVKGTALYTANFTPPTEPLTEVTNTKLLCCQSNTSATAAAVVPGTAPNTRNWSARTNWNSGGTLTNASSYPLTAAFDGNLNTTFAMSYAGSMIWTAPATISFSTGIEVYVNSSHGVGNQGYITTISGSQQSKVDVNADANWQSIYSGSGTFDKLEITRNTGGNNNNLWITAIRVDGVVLVDAIAAYGDASATNFNPFTDDINAIRGQETGYATLNPLKVSGLNANITSATLSNGNLTSTNPASTAFHCRVGTIGVDSGKWFYEYTMSGTITGFLGGWADPEDLNFTDAVGNTGRSYGYYATGNVRNSNNNTSFGASYTAGDVIGCAIDLDNYKIYWSKNGVWQNGAVPAEGTGSIYTVTSGYKYFPAVSTFDSSSSVTVNFGQKPFKFPPPDGFQPLSLSTVQPEKVIARPDQYVDAITYSGNSTSSNTITDLNFNSKPDFVWIKARSGSSSPGSQNHYLVDSVRGANGASGTSKLYSNSTGGENDGQTATTNGVRFIRNGFELTTNNDGTNANNNYVAWCWKAGGSKGTFNVDDVGYTNASDVNMNVGALNSASYNTSDRWRDDVAGQTYGSQPKTRLFDGNIAQNLIAESGYSLTFSPSGFSSITSLRVYGSSYTGAANGIVINGTDYTNLFPSGSTSPGWATIPETSLTSIVWNTASNGLENGSLNAIEVDGKILIDDDATPPNVPSIVPTGCSVGTKQGFSIITYSVSSNSTVAHGLTQAPEFGIFKCTSENNSNWGVYYTVRGSNANWMSLNSTDAQGSGVDFVKFYDKYVQIASNSFAGQGAAGVGYMWHSVPGLQKFGIYNSNGSTDGNFVELGFRPAILWIKSAVHEADTTSWCIFTDETYPNNPFQKPLYANKSINEGYRGNGSNQGTFDIDLLSNGFKLRTVVGEVNEGGANDTYIYCAWAKAPTVNLYGAQSNAR